MNGTDSENMGGVNVTIIGDKNNILFRFPIISNCKCENGELLGILNMKDVPKL